MPPLERHNRNVILFVTIGTWPKKPAFNNLYFHDAFLGACVDADSWRVGFYMIMPDHLHLFCAPACHPPVPIKKWSSYLKERITKHFRKNMEGERRESRGKPVPSRNAACTPWKWQSDCWDTQLRDSEHYREKWEYFRMNPVRKGLVKKPEDWRWRGEIHELCW